MTELMRQRWTRSCAADWYAGQHEKHGCHQPGDELLTFLEDL
jgi:hypothetical protein